MNHSKEAFIQLALQCNALQFGEFILKSGRKSPYFFNAGLFYSGKTLHLLGQFYAQALIKHDIEFEHLFGPAYKGLPLATTTAVALSELGIDKTVTFNRKEAKDHGEGGELIGAPLTGRTVIIDDVITAGTAFREAYQQIERHGGTLKAVIIALDRCERGASNKSALQEIQAEGIQVLSLITLFDLIDYLHLHEKPEQAQLLEAHYKQYGCGI